ncbi:uncharacterized protein [Triticum aestivum]|uniref:uncharacterized protein n=1 Tax=Triticum aestivum TaxID=4565 RepID=UPI001D003753|nr:uncharacterized protein LOC123101177 [Triticum aestivum]
MHSQRVTVVATSSKSEGPRNENSKNITPAPGNATNLQQHTLGDVSNVDMHSQMGPCLLTEPNGPRMETMLRGQTNTHPPPPGHVLDVDPLTQMSGVVDEPAISDHDASLPTYSAITAANGADLAESSNDGDTTAKSIVITDSRQAKRAHDRERKRAYDRERREKLTSEQREQINARRRETYHRKKELGPKFLEEQNRKTREQRIQRRDSLTAEKRADMNAERKTRYMSRKNTPCPESIAMRRPDLPTTSATNQSLHSGASPVSTNMAGHSFKSNDSLSAENASATRGPTYIRNIETDGAYLSRTLGDGAVDGNLITINEHLTSADQQTSDRLTIADNGADEQRHESRAKRRTRERSCKGSMAAKKHHEKIGKRKSCTKVPHGERNALLDRRNESFADDMDAYLSCLMNDNVNPDNLFDDEYYLFAGEGSDADDMEHDELKDDHHNTYVDHDPLDYVYSNLPDHTHILKHAANCDHCKAKKFESEAPGFCCRSGQIELKQPEPIPELMRLWSSTDADSRHFRENIRFFNGHFSFTTLGVSLDESYTNMKSGVYTFRAHGTIYHNVHSFGPTSRPEHLQLYFYDDDPGLTHRKAAI